MVTEPLNGYRSPGARVPNGVAGRLRPHSSDTERATSTKSSDVTGTGGVKGTGDVKGTSAMGDPDPTAPQFATVPWGYRRCEVDAWAAWVARLIAQGRSETVRADSAEATLRATLARLDELERSRGDRPEPTDAGELPRRRCPPGRTDGGAAQAAQAEQSAQAAQAEQSAQEAQEAQGTAPAAPTPRPERPEREPRARATTPLQVVDTTLQEVMSLLHRLADQGDTARPPER